MAKVKYYAKENTKVGTHSFYAVPVPNGTLTFNEVCEEACRNTSIEPSIMKAAVAEYMKTVQSNVLKGFRVPVGEQFITVYPNLNVSVKDTKDSKTGEVTVATAKMVMAKKGKSRLGASVSIKFFASKAAWPSAARSSRRTFRGRRLTSAQVLPWRTRTSRTADRATTRLPAVAVEQTLARMNRMSRDQEG